MAAGLRASSSSDPGRPDAGGAFESWVTWQAARTEAGDEEVVVVDHSQGAWSRRELEALRAEVAGSPLETLLTVIASASPDGIVVADLPMRAALEHPSVRSSEERRVGQAGVSTCSARRSTDPYNTQHI